MKKFVLLIILFFIFVGVSGRSPLHAQDTKTVSPAKDQTAVPALISNLKFDEAETICKKTLKEQPENMNAFTDLISIYAKTGRFDEALFTIEEMKDLKADPNLIHLLMGKIYFTQGKFADAIKEFEAIADKTSPYYPDTLNNLGITYTKLGNPIKAKEYFDAYLKIKPIEQQKPAVTEQCSVTALINSAAADINKNDLASAKEKLSKAVSADPYNIEAYYNAAVLNYLESKYDDSLKTLYKITDTKVFYPYADYLIGKNLAALGRADEAQIILNKSVKEYPLLVESYLELANINIKAGEYQKADTCLQKVNELVPDMHSLQILYGMLYFKQGKIKEAIDSFEKTLENNETVQPDIYYNLAVCYELNKDNKNAVKYYKKYLKSNPKDTKEIEKKITKLSEKIGG